jgi:transcriptional regulator with XRE-family HTH domain
MGKVLFIFKTEEDLKRLGIFFKTKREKRSVLQGKMAEGNIAQSYLSKIERAKQRWNPTMTTLMEHARRLNCEIVIREKSPSKPRKPK